ncbi:MAG TPA: VWA domain-containing protein [Vicinamibacterales bacterium]|nr:VWA domain-containing protein [Vicinamibacterales bacterium]
MRTACALLLACALGAAVSAQNFRSNVLTVPVTVTVVDGNGRLITGLMQQDFEIFEDGTLQTVTTFTNERVAVSLGVLLDVSDSMRGQKISDAGMAVERFVGDLLRVEDEAFIGLFNHRPRLASAWTRPPSSLKDRLSAVLPSGGTAIYDAVAQSAEMFDRRTKPRAALVVISDGADTASDRSLQQARDAVVKRDAFVYAIAIDSPGVAASTRVNPAALRDLTGPTGGYTEVVHEASELGPATQRIAEELNSQYTIGYTPARALDGSWRTIRVRIKGQPYFVRARQGYMAERGSFR